MTAPTTAAGRALVRRFGPGLSQRQLVEADIAAIEAEAIAAYRARLVGAVSAPPVRRQLTPRQRAAVLAAIEETE
jgi:hypothetical protein